MLSRLLGPLRFLVSGIALWWLFQKVNVAQLGDAIRHLSVVGVLLAMTTVFVNNCVGTARWSLLLHATGADNVPKLGTLLRLYFVAGFYNTFVPGGVTGDILRGVASRNAYSEDGTTRAVSVVFIERALGLVGLLFVVACASILNPIIPGLTWFAVLGVLGALVAVGLMVSGPTLAARVPWPRAKALLNKFPRVMHFRPFSIAMALSGITQLGVALTGYILMWQLSPGARFLDSLSVVPTASAMAFLPITVGGAGAREAVFVALYAHVGVPEDRALIASLLYWALGATIALIGAFLPVPELQEQSGSHDREALRSER